MKKSIVLIFYVLIFSCSFFENEEPKAVLIEKDRADLNESVSTNTAMLYKFIKVSYKFSHLEEHKVEAIKDAHPELEDMYKGANALIDILNKSADNDGSKSELSVLDYVNIYRNYTKTKEATKNFDEDVLPPFFLLNTSNSKQFNNDDIEKLKALEHCMFASFSLALKDAGLPICFYELSQIEPHNLPNEPYKINYVTARNIMLYIKGLYYLSEEELTENINWINANPQIDFKGMLYIPNHLKPTLEGKERAVILIYNHLLRGLDRLKMNSELSEKEALEDFESMINVSEKAEIDNEITQAVQVYFYLKNENPQKTIKALKKLKTSALLSDKEKKTIDEAVHYLEKRETGKVLNGIYDKTFLGKIVVTYIFEQAKAVDWEKLLKEKGIELPKESKQFIENVDQIIQKVNTYSNEENIEKAKKDIHEKGKDIFNKTKEWLAN